MLHRLHWSLDLVGRSGAVPPRQALQMAAPPGAMKPLSGKLSDVRRCADAGGEGGRVGSDAGGG